VTGDSAGGALCLSLALPRACEFGGAAPSMSHSIAGSTRPVAFADALRQICGSRCARRLRVLLDYPPQPITERDQITPLGQPKRYIASLLVDSGEGVRLVWSLNNLDVAHNRQRTHKQTDGSHLALNRPAGAGGVTELRLVISVEVDEADLREIAMAATRTPHRPTARPRARPSSLFLM
jgi:hypothetical protein